MARSGERLQVSGRRGRWRGMLRATVVTLAFALALIGCGKSSSTSSVPPDPHAKDGPTRPLIPDNFKWTGYYVVPDLDVNVPFTWDGRDGNMQMTAGGENETIHFTNLIVDGQLYTLTYKWPKIPRMKCSHVGAFTVKELNEGFKKAAFVGRETLHDRGGGEVDHFRSVGVLDLPKPVMEALGQDTGEIPVRLPLMAGDIYTDAGKPDQLRQLLHFGVQNLYDPNLDEWIVIEEHSGKAGKVELPKECVKK